MCMLHGAAVGNRWQQMARGLGVTRVEKMTEADDNIEPPKVLISSEELDKTQIPLAFRDYCAHLLPELNACRSKSFYAPWACENERLAWHKCQYDEYQRRMRVLDKRLKEKEAQS